MKRVLLFLITLFSVSSWADNRPTLVVSFRDNPPDMVVYCGDSHAGPLRSVIEEAAERIGHQVKWKSLSLSASLRELADGKLDVIPYLFNKTTDREAIGRFSDGLGGRSRVTSFLIGKDASLSISRFSDLSAFTIGYRKDSYYFPEFHDSRTLRTVAYEVDGKMVRDFVAGKIDAIVLTNKPTIERTFQTLGFNDFKYAELTYTRDASLYLLYSRDPRKQALFDRLDQAIMEMKREGLIADIYDSFGAEPLR